MSYEQRIRSGGVPIEDDTSSLQCQAKGCPNRWTVDNGTRLCSAHAWAEAHDWPMITEEQIQLSWMRAQRRNEPPPVDQQKRLTAEDKRAILQKLREVMAGPKDPRAWLYRLRERESAGEQLSEAQRRALHDCRHIQ